MNHRDYYDVVNSTESGLSARIADDVIHRLMGCTLLKDDAYRIADVLIRCIKPEIDPDAQITITINRGPHLLTARNGKQDFCGGPGVCPWCDGVKVLPEEPR